jgi:hypothetical protein
MGYWRHLGNALIGHYSEAVVRMAAEVENGRHYRSSACYHDIHHRCEGACEWCSKPCRCLCHVTLEYLYDGLDAGIIERGD